MAKSLRSKRKKRLRTLRREIAEPFYDKKDTAKLAAQEAALAAPKLPVRGPPPSTVAPMHATTSSAVATSSSMEIETTDGNQGFNVILKPAGGVGKKLKKKLNFKKGKHHGKGKRKIRRKKI